MRSPHPTINPYKNAEAPVRQEEPPGIPEEKRHETLDKVKMPKKESKRSDEITLSELQDSLMYSEVQLEDHAIEKTLP